jgi:ABC-type amino acid transport substrate-binding protein
MKRLVSLLGVMLLVLSGCGNNEADAAKQIVVGLECDYAPFNWSQLEDTDTAFAISDNISFCDGYDIAIASEIADGLDKELVVKQIAWEGLEPALNSGEIDMIVAGMTDTADRREQVSFSSAYYASDMVLLVRADSVYATATSLDDFAGAAVVAQRGTFHDNLVDQISGVTHQTPLATFPLLVNSVSSKEADAMVSERPVAMSIVTTNPGLVIVDFEEGNGFSTSAEDTTVSVALRKVDTDLLEDINSILASISNETRNQWMEDALSRQPEAE